MIATIVGVDVGSVRPPSRFAWASLRLPDLARVRHGNDPQSAVTVLAASLGQSEPAVLAIEAPLSLPVPAADGPEPPWQYLGRARDGEGNRPWSAAAGAGSLASGLVQTAWMCSRLHHLLPELTATTRAAAWLAGTAQLLLTEAFVSGAGRPVPVPEGQHAADAAAAARDCAERLSRGETTPDVRCAPHTPLNLGAIVAAWAGLRISPTEARGDLLIFRTHPVPLMSG